MPKGRAVVWICVCVVKPLKESGKKNIPENLYEPNRELMYMRMFSLFKYTSFVIEVILVFHNAFT